MKIFEGLINSKNMVFDVKKLVNVGVGLTLQRKGGKSNASGMSRRSSGFTLPMAGFCWRTYKL
jgi:hypothetical protein